MGNLTKFRKRILQALLWSHLSVTSELSRLHFRFLLRCLIQWDFLCTNLPQGQHSLFLPAKYLIPPWNLHLNTVVYPHKQVSRSIIVCVDSISSRRSVRWIPIIPNRIPLFSNIPTQRQVERNPKRTPKDITIGHESNENRFAEIPQSIHCHAEKLPGVDGLLARADRFTSFASYLKKRSRIVVQIHWFLSDYHQKMLRN